ncbi:transcription/translation regulatory transformer protein RfaH [Nitrincola tapanii]|uniref:Transcription antitermination protein RfaH n=1 Tax=Nitrincola tapanii TaxID=1708751 RepID=A0A5A9W054_9GAMM|nr:transcription/translation regulatory transformer protein RfaH [Nitrincola tapanii]KAA0873963.1 transcription/translation regulatory transformer protein RfaH [Nitrincola tapanii]
MAEGELEVQQRAWFLVQCKAGETERAFENLARQNYECFMPQIEQEKIRKGKRVRLLEPLFPGYLFIHLDQLADNWRPIRSTRGVSRLVSFGGLPLAVSNDLIADLQKRCQNVVIELGFNAGDRVRVTDGAFSELEAVFESYDGQERVIILLDFLQRQQRVTIPISGLKKLD